MAVGRRASACDPSGPTSNGGTAPVFDPSTGHFRLLLEALPAGAYTCDRDGLITYFNGYAIERQVVHLTRLVDDLLDAIPCRRP